VNVTHDRQFISVSILPKPGTDFLKLFVSYAIPKSTLTYVYVNVNQGINTLLQVGEF
jgi:hypothetical protein